MDRDNHEHRHVDLLVDLSLHPDARHAQAHTSAEMRQIVLELGDSLRGLGYAQVDILATSLALVEVMANAFRHGNKGDPNKLIQLRYLVTPDEVLLEVEFVGSRFDPARVPRPPAECSMSRWPTRGLFLARAYASWLSFNARGNLVTICRHRSTP
jgi:anti-sigma regulatory factor (Ser/Thr protein kinase)